MEQIPGQMSMFDVHDSFMMKPHEYKWQRYIGQKVRMHFIGDDRVITGRIERIDKYYTLIQGDDGEPYVGTPTTCYPIEEESE